MISGKYYDIHFFKKKIEERNRIAHSNTLETKQFHWIYYKKKCFGSLYSCVPIQWSAETSIKMIKILSLWFLNFEASKEQMKDVS